MASVLHFMPEDAERAACGAQIFLCNEATNDPRHVDCSRCKRTKAFKNYDPTRYDVDVWNHGGDVIRWFRRVNANEVESIRREYADNPSVSVIVEKY